MIFKTYDLEFFLTFRDKFMTDVCKYEIIKVYITKNELIILSSNKNKLNWPGTRWDSTKLSGARALLFPEI